MFLALQFLRQRQDVLEEIEQLKNEESLIKQDEKAKKFTFFQLIKKKEYHLPLFLAFVLSVSLTMSGMSGVSMLHCMLCINCFYHSLANILNNDTELLA